MEKMVEVVVCGYPREIGGGDTSTEGVPLSLVMENRRVTLTVSASYITSANVTSDTTMGGRKDSYVTMILLYSAFYKIIITRNSEIGIAIYLPPISSGVQRKRDQVHFILIFS